MVRGENVTMKFRNSHIVVPSILVLFCFLGLGEQSKGNVLVWWMLVDCHYKTLTPKPKSGGDHHVSRGEFLAWLQKGSEKALDVKKVQKRENLATKTHGVFYLEKHGVKIPERF